jgi:asparagine synthase (glutamine-hydrolysing)
MCGIAGIIGTSTANPAAVRAMTDIMAHRGPDGEGIWKSPSGRACLGHRRLAIIDLHEQAAQPMTSADDRQVLTYNGEIYNYRELRQELEQNGRVFVTESDTEVILHAYAVWGESCLDRLNGMFAFALFDTVEKTLFCARDRFGEKPFLFVARSGFFAFASEYKALLTLDGVGSEIDDQKLMQFFTTPANALDQSRETVFRDVLQLLPGEKLILNTDSLGYEVSSYWTPSDNVGSRRESDDDVAAEFFGLLEDSVKIRLRSDVPVGSCLSGGMDSSAITCIARRLVGPDARYDSFTGRFPGAASDEGQWANIVSQAAGTAAFEVSPTAARFVDELDDFLWLNELPVDSASQYAQWCVFRLAKDENVTVLLDGQGADEILGGYEQYFANYLLSGKTIGANTKQEEQQIRDRYPLALSGADQVWKRKLPRSLSRLAAHTLKRGTNPAFGMRREWANELKDDDAVQTKLHTVLRGDTFSGFLTTLLRYGDRNSMAHSREVRLPFCDHRLTEFVWSLPAQQLMGGAQTKKLLREATKGVLPDSIRMRWKKQGFLPPLTDWLEGDLMPLLEETLQSGSFQSGPHWLPEWWEKALTRFRNGEKPLASPLWKVMMSELWRDRFLGRISALKRFSPTI